MRARQLLKTRRQRFVRPPQIVYPQLVDRLVVRSLVNEWPIWRCHRTIRFLAIVAAALLEPPTVLETVNVVCVAAARALTQSPRNIWKICRRGVGVADARAKALSIEVLDWREARRWLLWQTVRWALAGVFLFSLLQAHTPGVLAAALGANTIWEVESGASDTLNGGAFDPVQATGAGFSDGAATVATSAAPVFTSASYNFLPADVGAWVFIGSGTNWTLGWYKITAVGGNAATLDATIGHAVVSATNVAGSSLNRGLRVSDVLGCATVASPTAAVWAIDYSKQVGAQFTYTDLASTGAGLTITSAAKAFGKQHVGNAIVITGGTNFTVGRYIIASVAAGVATVLGAANITTGVGANGTGGQGGALATIGQAGAHNVNNNRIYIKTGTYTFASASTNIATGCWASSAIDNIAIEGYDTVPGDLLSLNATGTRPTLISDGAITTFTLIAYTGFANLHVRCLILDGNSRTSSRGLNIGSIGHGYFLKGQNFTNAAFTTGAGGNATWTRCRVTTCTTIAPFLLNGSAMCIACDADANTITPYSNVSGIGSYLFCKAVNNTGASTDGFSGGTGLSQFINCTAYGNGRDGIRAALAGASIINCIAESNTGVGINLTGTGGYFLLNNGVYLNSGGNTVFTVATRLMNLGLVTGTGSFFTNAAGSDFSLNNTSGAGASLRAAGYPGTFPDGLTTGYLDIGAAQHRDPTPPLGQTTGARSIGTY